MDVQIGTGGKGKDKLMYEIKVEIEKCKKK